jgi:hypothetical protein
VWNENSCFSSSNRTIYLLWFLRQIAMESSLLYLFVISEIILKTIPSKKMIKIVALMVEKIIRNLANIVTDSRKMNY